MGCDIHGVFQRHTPTGWVDVPSRFDERRHYQLFAVLAGVRNGYGFAGVPMGDAVTPIAEPRGLPADFKLDEGSDYHLTTPETWAAHSSSEYVEPGDSTFGALWLGDHSHSWLEGAEMLAWAEAAPVVRKCGVITREAFAAWDKKTRPGEYSGGISGPSVVVVEQPEAEAGATSSHVRVFWHSKLRDELDYFFGEVARLVAEHGRVRFVFGFDS